MWEKLQFSAKEKNKQTENRFSLVFSINTNS